MLGGGGVNYLSRTDTKNLHSVLSREITPVSRQREGEQG